MRRILLALTLLASCDKAPAAPSLPAKTLPAFAPAAGGTMRLLPDGLYIDETPVTQEVYQKVMGINPSKQKNPQAPVAGVQWVDAARFCNKCSEAEGLEPCYDQKTWNCDGSKSGYRLPTEAEWEIGCRAGAKTKLCLGDRSS